MPGNACLLDAGTGVRKLLFTLCLSPVRPRRLLIVDAVDVGPRRASCSRSTRPISPWSSWTIFPCISCPPPTCCANCSKPAASRCECWPARRRRCRRRYALDCHPPSKRRCRALRSGWCKSTCRRGPRLRAARFQAPATNPEEETHVLGNSGKDIGNRRAQWEPYRARAVLNFVPEAEVGD